MDYWTLEQPDLMQRFKEIGRRIRDKELLLGREHYALALAHGVLQAIHCGYRKVFAVELGVAWGDGLLDFCKAAEFFRDECDIEVDVWGIDNASGLPPIADYRDHPEIWHTGQFNMGDADHLRSKLPLFGHLIIGDVGEAIDQLFYDSFGSRLCCVAIDLDYYSSTKRALKIFDRHADVYVPAVPTYVDDVEVLLTYNSWCGEAAAINEFNRSHPLRKIERNPHFHIYNFHVCHILDHVLRSGKVRPRLPFEIRAI